MPLRSIPSRCAFALLALLSACGAGEVRPVSRPEVVVPPPSEPAPDACTRAAAQVLGSLKGPLTVTVYMSPGLPKVGSFVRQLRSVLDEYRALSQGKLRFSIVEAMSDPLRREAKEAGLQEIDLGEASEDSTPTLKGFRGIAFAYGGEKEVIPVLPPDQPQGLEYWILSKIQELRDRADNRVSRIGVVTGKEEIKLSDANLIAQQNKPGGPSIKSVLGQALPFYTIEEVELSRGDAAIDKELASLVITQPGKDYTDDELRRIDQFMMLGGKALVVLAGAVNVKASDAALAGTLDLHGLDRLLGGYGIEMKKEAIFDWARPAIFRLQTQGQGILLPYPAVVEAQHDDRLDDDRDQLLDTRFQAFFRMDQVAFPFTSPLVAHPDRQPEARMKVVARTSPRSTVVSTEPVDLKLGVDLKPVGETAQRVIAIALEGTIKSAFGGRQGDKAATSGRSRDDKGRVLVIASSQFLANPLARAGNPPPLPPQMAMMGTIGGDEDLMMLSQPYAQQYLTATILAFKNMLDWSINDADLNACSAKVLGANR